MNRREFLFNAAVGLFVAASPKIIFDMGANTWRGELAAASGVTAEQAIEAFIAGQISAHRAWVLITDDSKWLRQYRGGVFETSLYQGQWINSFEATPRA